MEEQKMNEKESLELIAQMIRVTKQSIGSGCGNKFLMYGYTAAIANAARTEEEVEYFFILPAKIT